jgi:hypothetical protein
LVSIGSYGEALASTENELLTNFEGTGNQLIAPHDGYIYGYTDKADKGTSTIVELVEKDRESVLNPIVKRGKGAGNSNGFLKISGEITTAYQYGYVGCGFNFFEDKRKKDLTKYKGIRFKAKGSENYFTIKLEIAEDVSYAYHETSFMPPEQWEEVVVYFENFRQPPWATKIVALSKALNMVKGIQFQTKGQPLKSYELYLDDIELIK